MKSLFVGVVLFVLVFVSASGIKLYFNSLVISSHPEGSQAMSPTESEQFGLLSAYYASTIISTDDQLLQMKIKEVWVERCAVDRYDYIWLHRKEATPGYRILIRAEGGRGLWLWSKGCSEGFSVSGQYYCSNVLPSVPEAFAINVHRGPGGEPIGQVILKKQ